ncbi:hypothetical protein J14TS5_56260 [Paenibacillus lautus]|nr:hypothetical protein J14TS5_56260 [Paenibacillus lautus]
MTMVVGFSGCSNTEAKTGKWSAIEVGRRIQETIAFDHLKEGDIAKLQKLYQIPANTLCLS